MEDFTHSIKWHVWCHGRESDGSMRPPTRIVKWPTVAVYHYRGGERGGAK